MQSTIKSQNILQQIEVNYQGIASQNQYIIDAVLFLQNILTQFNDTTFISFNGGKDATIVLVLTYLALKNIEKRSQFINLEDKKNELLRMPQGLYFEEPNPFPQMMKFYENMVQLFSLKMHKLSSKKYAQQLKGFSNRYKLDCVIMGSRNDDPYCQHLQLITESDVNKGYPAFKRINPIVKWDYFKVWNAIKTLNIPYCSLYEQGYTSIGNMNNTVKNPSLICQNDKCKSPFEARPETERVCRVGDKK